MRTRSLIVAAVCGVTILGWALGHGSGPAVAARECPADVGAADHAVGVAAVHQGRLMGASPGGDTDTGSGAVERQVATSAGRTAYVEDRRGADAIVVSTPHGIRVLSQPGEAYHPTWWRAGRSCGGSTTGSSSARHLGPVPSRAPKPA